MTAFPETGALRIVRSMCIGVLLLLASHATAREDGHITLRLPDEELNLPLSAGHSDWTSSQGFVQVSILTRPNDLDTWQRFQSLRLAFDLLRNRAQMPEMSLLRRTGDAAFERWYGRADRGGLSVTVSDQARNGDLLHIRGTFAGTLGRSRDFGQTIDISTPMPVSGTFEVTLMPIARSRQTSDP